MEICNTTDVISALENMSNQVTANYSYLDANLSLTLLNFTAGTHSNSYVLDAGDDHIILNDIRQFQVFHLCNGNVKVLGVSNVSIQGTFTTYIIIKSYNRTVNHIKVSNAVFVPLSPFNFLPPRLFILVL